MLVKYYELEKVPVPGGDIQGRQEVPVLEKVPVFKADNYEMYEHQVEVWEEMCGVKKSKQASVLWLTLPDDHASYIKAKIYNKIKDDLKTDAGVNKFLKKYRTFSDL